MLTEDATCAADHVIGRQLGDFHELAEKRYAGIIASGKTIPWGRDAHLPGKRLAGKKARRPKARKLARREMPRVEIAPEAGDGFERSDIIEAFNVLESNPLIGRPAPGNKRELIIGRRSRGYVALYRYVPEIDTVVHPRPAQPAGSGLQEKLTGRHGQRQDSRYADGSKRRRAVTRIMPRPVPDVG